MRSSQIQGAPLLFVLFKDSWNEVVLLQYAKNVFTVLSVLVFCRVRGWGFCWKSVSRVRNLLEAAGLQIFVSGTRSRTSSCLSQDVGYPVWQQQQRGASKEGGSGLGMERCSQDRRRRQTRSATVPCSAEWPFYYYLLTPPHLAS